MAMKVVELFQSTELLLLIFLSLYNISLYVTFGFYLKV